MLKLKPAQKVSTRIIESRDIKIRIISLWPYYGLELLPAIELLSKET